MSVALDLIDQIFADYPAMYSDPDFYAAKARLRDSFNNPAMIQIVPGEAGISEVIVIDEVHGRIEVSI